MQQLEVQIKELIIDALNLEDLTPDEIDTKEPLFVDGLGLDSIDALELGMAVQKNFDVKIDAKNSDVRKHFYSVETLAQFISEQKANV